MVDILTGIHNVSIVLSTGSRVIHCNVHSVDSKNGIPAAMFPESGLRTIAQARTLVFPLCCTPGEANKFQAS